MYKFSKQALNISICLSMIFSVFLNSQEVEEVVVTATKQEKSVQDVPVSIEAFTAEDIDKNLIEDFSDLAEVVPGLIVDKAISTGASYSMRGVGSYGVGAAVVASLVTSFNGHSVYASALTDVGFHDLERIEVLKGPQGTLSGRNAVQGLVNLVTARPTGELEGKAELTMGNFNSERLNMVLNVPINERVGMRLATATFKRDGVIDNIHTGNDIDDRDNVAGRLSIDFDISEKTQMELTYDYQKGDDKRQNIGINYCQIDPLFGCSPFTKGVIGQPSHPNGSTSGFFNFAAALNADPTANSYEGVTILNSMDRVNLNRDPDFLQTHEVSQVQINHEINDEYALIVKGTYVARSYNHLADNDYTVGVQPFPGLFPVGHPASSIPMQWEGCWGGFHNNFCEVTTADRTYEFAYDESETKQGEITLISSLDGPLNFQVGYYYYDNTQRNIYQVQTAAWNLIRDGGAHPYNLPLFGGALTGSGSTDFHIPWALSGFSAAALPALLTGYTTPIPVQGYFNDDHIRIKSKAILGEMYYDISDQTQLTVGIRYSDDVVKDSIFSCLTYTSCNNLSMASRLTSQYVFSPTQVIEADDSTSYKLAVKHDIDDNRMVYASYTTAVKAGGNNPNAQGLPDPYDQEETGVFEIGAKGIFLDGAMLLNAAYFQNKTDGMLISSIVNAGSRNVNTDAEINGLEGNMVLFLSETTSIDVTLLMAESEITNLSLINPVNINNATSRALLPPALGGGLVQRLGAGGVLTVGNTDAGLIYKFAGFMCLVPFNPFAPGGCPNPGIPVDVSGNKLPQSPELSYSIGLNQDFIGENGTTTARLTYRFMDEREGTVYNQPHLKMPEHKFFDATVTYRPNNGNWYVKLEAKNLANDRYIGSWYLASGLQGGNKFATVTEPRTWGLAFGTSF